jgi:ornithine decarboxylase
MKETLESFSDVGSLLRSERPAEPVYCVFPHVYRTTTREFLQGFPGRVLFAVKANNQPTVIRLLAEAGVAHFDCASLAEISLVHSVVPDAKKYFMIPTRIRGAAAKAQREYGVRHFVVDHLSGLEGLAREIDMSDAVVFGRMAVHHESAIEDLSTRFGAEPDQMPTILQAIRETGAEPALAFNVGSSVTDPDAYRHSVSIAQSVLEKLPFRLRLIDVGGGFPRSYPEFIVPPIGQYFSTISKAFSALPVADNAELLCEPGRALAAPGMSALAEVLLRKDDRLFINDGMYGIFWELRSKAHQKYPVRAYRDGHIHDGETQLFQLNGPTCDGTDTLPGMIALPADICPGDHLEFGNIGAYSLSGRTDFNGYYSDRIVIISSSEEKPPGLDAAGC